MNYRVHNKSVFIPLVAAIRASVEDSHRLVRAPDLYRFEVGEIVFAARLVHAEDARLVYVLPRIFPAKHVVNLLPFKPHLVLKLLIDPKHVGTRLAEESEVIYGLLSEQDIGARGAEKH